MVKKYHFVINLSSAETRRPLNNAAATLGETVADSGQLTTILAATQAVNNFMPFKQQVTKINPAGVDAKTGKTKYDFADVKQDFKGNSQINFYTANNNMIFIFVLLNYPNISAICVEKFVEKIYQKRKTWKYDQDVAPQLKTLLESLDRTPEGQQVALLNASGVLN